MAENNLKPEIQLVPLTPIEQPTAKLPLLSYWVQKCNPNAFKENVLLLVQHLLTDSVPFIKAFLDCGCAPENMIVVGIWYSTKEESVAELQKMGISLHVSENSAAFNKALYVALVEALEKCTKNKKLIIVEDGGYYVQALHESLPKIQWEKICLGAVEQTTRGLEIDSLIHKEIGLKFPVISIADTYIKKEIEGPQVARAVARNLNDILRKMQMALAGKRVAIFGFGTIGRNLTEVLRNDGCQVYVVEKDGAKMLNANLQGYKVCSAVTAVEECEILIGASGAQSITPELIRQLRDNTILVSASSQQVEIAIGELENLALESKSQISGVGTQYELSPRNQRVILVADGTPINFRSDSLPNQIIDLVNVQLFGSVVKLSEIGDEGLSPNIYSCPVDDSSLSQLCIDVYKIMG